MDGFEEEFARLQSSVNQADRLGAIKKEVHAHQAEEESDFVRTFRAAERKKQVEKIERKPVKRTDGEKVWMDKNLAEWPENDYRIFVKRLGTEVTDQVLTEAFSKYRSLYKARVVYDTSGRHKGYGFVSLLDVNEYIDAMKTMEHAFIGNRRVTLECSKWRNKNK